MKTVYRFSTHKSRLPLYDLNLGIRTEKKHYLALLVNRSILLYGFGIFGTIMEKELEIEYGLLMDDFCNPRNQKLILMKCEGKVQFTGHRDITELFFHYPIRLRRFTQYILYLNVSGYQTYVGIRGRKYIREDKVKFMFAPDFNRVSLSTPKEGNFPFLLYKNIEKYYHPNCEQRKIQQTKKKRDLHPPRPKDLTKFGSRAKKDL